MLDKLFKYPIDVWAALLVFGTFLILVLSYTYVENVWLLCLISLVLMPARISVVAYNHNHIHVPTFRQISLNRLLEIAMFFQTGSSPESGTINHVCGHHAQFPNPARDDLNWIREDGRVMTSHEFAIKKMLHHYPSCFKFGTMRKKLFSNFLIYSAICFIALIVVTLLKPTASLVLFILPMLFMLYLLKLSASNHHRGLEFDDDYSSTRTNESKFYNIFTWNAGYHAAHHFKMAMHWSLLPEYHEELREKIPSNLQGPDWNVSEEDTGKIFPAPSTF